MELGKYIKEILIDRGKVIVPDLGTFEKATIPARINKKTGEMLPPEPNILFDDSRFISDNIFCHYIGKDLKITTSEAAQKVEKQVKVWLSLLKANKKVAINGLGYLQRTKDKKIVFHANIDADNFPEFYGLSAITVSKKEPGSGVSATKVAAVKQTKSKASNKKVQKKDKKDKKEKKENKRKWRFLFFLIPVLILIALAVWKFDYVKEGSNKVVDYFSGMNSEKKAELENKRIQDSIKVAQAEAERIRQDSIKKQLEKEKAEAEAILQNYKIVDSKTNGSVKPTLADLESASKIHIIAGSFSSKVNAKQERLRLQNLGFENAKVLPANNRLYRVSIDSYDDVKAAVKDFKMIKTKDSALDVWILLD